MRAVTQAISLPDYTFYINEFRLVIKTAFMADVERNSLIKFIQDYIDERFYFLAVDIKRHTDHFYYSGDTASESDRLFSETSPDGSETRFDLVVINFSLPQDDPDNRYFCYDFKNIYEGWHNFKLPREAALGMVREITDLVLFLVLKSGSDRFTFYGMKTSENGLDYGQARYLFIIKNGLDFYHDKASEAGVFIYLDHINKNWYKVLENSKSRYTVQGIWKFYYNFDLSDNIERDELFGILLEQQKQLPALEVIDYWNNYFTFLSIAGEDYYTIAVDKSRKQIYLEQIMKYHESLMVFSDKNKITGSLYIHDLLYKVNDSKRQYELCNFHINCGYLFRSDSCDEFIDLEKILCENIDEHP